jgi:hypothetical protein
MPNPVSADIRSRFGVLFAKRARWPRDWPPFDDFSGVRFTPVPEAQARFAPDPTPNPRNTGHGRLAPCHDFPIGVIHQDPDITLKELQGALADAHDVAASVPGIERALKRPGYTSRKRPSLRMSAGAQA